MVGLRLHGTSAATFEMGRSVGAWGAVSSAQPDGIAKSKFGSVSGRLVQGEREADRSARSWVGGD